MIKSNGSFHLDKDSTCNLHYLADWLNHIEADVIFTAIKSNIQVSLKQDTKNLTLDFRSSKDNKEFISRKVDAKDLCSLVESYAEKVQSSIVEMFKIQTKFDQAQIICLANEKNHIPYQSYPNVGSSEDQQDVVAIITVGAPRTLQIKTIKGRRVTHNVPLLSGSLSVMSGSTQNKYLHSIPKVKTDKTVQRTNMFDILRSSSFTHCYI